MGWEKVKLGDVLHRKTERVRLFPEEEYKLVTIRLHHKGVVLRNKAKGKTIKSHMSLVKAGDFVLSGIDARNGAFGIVPDELDGAVITNDFWCIEPDETKMKKEFLLFLTSTKYFDYICNQSSDGTTQRIRLQKNKFYDYKIELPPIEDQENVLIQLRQKTELSEKIGAKQTHQLSLLKKIRQQILQDAVMGKLVEQDPDDEPASILLEKIVEEKQRLIAEGKIKKGKPLSDISDEDKPFDIPANWEWCRLGTLLTDSEGGKSPNCRNEPVAGNEWGVIKTTSIQEMQFMQNENKILPKAFKVQSHHVVKDKDLLITRAGPKNRVDIVCVVENLTKNLILSDKTIRLKYLPVLNNECFIGQALNSPAIKPMIEAKMTGMADSQVNISQANMKQFLIPLPPLNEQHRIVAKVEQLMKICNDLEQSIQQNQKYTQELLQVALKEALESSN